ncbi:hypothetical protein BGY98DRAFT_105652 [Russula aff. rugulosa BPL654]|nr:hypothetical protein BGY98DRAFT_105652 [Russula aff. rugulosa BPL654]
MVNWHDPSLLLEDYASLIKLNHALAGIFIWETVITFGFELDILRGKRPYRWTLWLYLGTRYTLLCTFIVFFIDSDGPKVPCHAFLVLNFALPYASWAFASLIIVLRVIAIWNRNIVVSLISVGIWAGAVALHIRNLTMLEAAFDPLVNSCVPIKTENGLVNALAVLVADMVLLLAMLIGLLRHASRRSTGLWKLLYQQCIIWIALATFSEIPPVVFLILNLNDVWNEMLTGPAITILTIGATRMYRSLSEYGTITKFVSSDLPRYSTGVSVHASSPPKLTKTFSPMNFAPGTQSGSGTFLSACEAPVFLPADQVLQVEFVPDMSDSSLGVYENRTIETAYMNV